jgi:peptidoglycan/LPS O-acetylase OafA/YrhL
MILLALELPHDKRSPMIASDARNEVQAAASTPRVRLDYLDGLRGLAALFVLLHHAHAELDYRYAAEGLKPWLSATKVLSWGHFSVSVFIILSGYCLMLPVARSRTGELRGGFADYIWRRARRILPPYYVALAFSLIIIWLYPALRYASSPDWNLPLKAFTPGILLSHALLIHNFSPGWINSIDLPMWSVATEWQIYFIFPVILLPVWRRWDIGALVAVGFLMGWIPRWLALRSLDGACFWFIGLFAQGMAAAQISFSADPRIARLRDGFRWGLISAFSWAGVFAAGLLLSRYGVVKEYRWLTDFFVGLAAASMIVACTKRITDHAGEPYPILLKVFNHRWAVALGVFSYSLYLVHYPLLALSNSVMSGFHIAPKINFLISFGIIVPLIVAAAYLFHLLFERPFMPGHLGARHSTAESDSAAHLPSKLQTMPRKVQTP